MSQTQSLTNNRQQIRIYLSQQALTTLSQLQSNTDHTLSELIERAVSKAYSSSLDEQTEKAMHWLK